MFKIGFDIGSTTIKGVVLDERDELIYLFYHRHLSNVANAIDFAYLQNWYQDSIDETKQSIWTDKHLEELFNDFYLIPKK